MHATNHFISRCGREILPRLCQLSVKFTLRMFTNILQLLWL